MIALEWLIPIVVLLIWIVSSIFKNTEEDRAAARKREAAGQIGEGRPSRRPVSEIDRFLEEVNRRRRQVAERERVPAPPPAARPPRSAPRSQATRTPSATPVARRSSPRASERPIPVEAVVVAEVARATAPIAQVVDAQERQPLPPLAPSPLPEVSAGPNPVLTQLSTFMQSNDSLRAAMLLHEVLGPPLSRRRRHS
jgi:hypothetical protein